MEETGYDIKKMVFWGWYHLSVGSTTERVFLYYALCHKQKKQKLDVLEKIQLYRVPFEEFEGLMERNEFHQCMGVAAWERYKTANSGNGGRQWLRAELLYGTMSALAMKQCVVF